MIVVFPNGLAMKNDADTGNVFAPEKVQAFANFEKDLLNDVIPFIEANYPVVKHRESRALAGFSIWYADSKDLYNWEDKGSAISTKGEGPKIFAWRKNIL